MAIKIIKLGIADNQRQVVCGRCLAELEITEKDVCSHPDDRHIMCPLCCQKIGVSILARK